MNQMAPAPDLLQIPPLLLGRLMPMYLVLDPYGGIRHTGPALARILPGALQGGRFFQRFQISHPAGLINTAALRQCGARRLRLHLTDDPSLSFRGLAVPLPDGGALLNLSFGIDLPQAVRRHQLTEQDFAPTDTAVELLFLIEANSLVTAELTGLTRRLQGAKAAAELHAQSDALTGLGNRRAADKMLDALVQGNSGFGLLHLDLDYFKQINDSFGHAAGDALLQYTGEILQSVARSSDLAARIGGDEFLLLLPGLTDQTALQDIARRILERMRRPLAWQDHLLTASASIGWLLTPGGETAADLLRQVDAALYEAKRQGRGQAMGVPMQKGP